MKIVSSCLVFILVVFCLPKTDFAAHTGKIELAGDILAVAIPLTAGALTLVHKDGEGTMQLVEAFAASAVVTYGLKYTVNERTPLGEKHSFPSFHTASAFTGAAFVQMRDGWKYGLPLYVLSSFVGYSRVEAKKHHTKDVLAGAAIGICSNLIFTTPFPGLTVSPAMGKGFAGVMIGKSF